MHKPVLHMLITQPQILSIMDQKGSVDENPNHSIPHRPKSLQQPFASSSSSSLPSGSPALQPSQLVEQATPHHHQIQSHAQIPTTMGDPHLPPITTASTDEAPMTAESRPAEVGTDPRHVRATSIISMDDLEAAQALEGLRADVGRGPNIHDASPSIALPSDSRRREPLLNLLTSSHPLLSSAINGSVSMYTSSKSNYPTFKYGAELFERTIGSQVVNTVGSVGRKTGVEDGIRWALKRRQTPDTAAESGEKRTKIDNLLNAEDEEPHQRFSNSDFYSHHHRAWSASASEYSYAESLPPYDTLSSPKYEESIAMDGESQSRNATPRPWHNRLMVSTSGLGVAMSEDSLRRLSYCLRWLRWANHRLGKHAVSLKQLVEEYEKDFKGGEHGNGKVNKEAGEVSATNASTAAQARPASLLSHQIQRLKSDVLSTLKHVVDVVSRYAGSALPENARNLVRRHLMSLPQRFRLATASGPADASSGSPLADTTAASAQRVLVLAEEGLDMMMQVSRVVNDTLVSAESWCQRLRMPRNSGDADATSGAGAGAGNGAGTGAGINGAPVMTQAQTTAPAQSAPPVPAGDIKLPIVAPMQRAYTPQDIEMAE